jgi:hypothetical protein
MSLLYFILSASVVATLAVQTSEHAASPQPAHVRNTFSFNVSAPQEKVAPLFGAQRERVWAVGWDPQFIYPQPPEDKQGVVFTVKHSHTISTWITTVFEPEKGHMQHVYFVPDAMVTLIDIHLTASGAAGTHVEVTYERTALNPELNDHVRQRGEEDAKSADHWHKAIEDYLKGKKPD